MAYRVLFTTERGLRHQQRALDAAPPELRVTMLPQPDRAELLRHLPAVDYWISERRGVVDAGMIAAAPSLRLIVRLGSLTHDIALDAARAARVRVAYWPQGDVIRAAEHVVMQLLAVGKRLRAAERAALAPEDAWGAAQRTDEDTFAFNWAGLTEIGSLWGQTVGILGFGEIGAELARRLQGWGCAVLYHRRQRLPAAVERALNISYIGWDELLAGSDYVVNLLPYSPQTDGLIDAAVFQRMKDGVRFVSAGSGSVVDEHALADALRSGKLAGAALDTFEWEPLQVDHPLAVLAQAGANVLLTPHIAGGSLADVQADMRAAYTTVCDHIAGRTLRYELV